MIYSSRVVCSFVQVTSWTETNKLSVLAVQTQTVDTIRWALRSGLRCLASGCSQVVCPNSHISPAVLDCSNSRKVRTEKRTSIKGIVGHNLLWFCVLCTFIFVLSFYKLSRAFYKLSWASRAAQTGMLPEEALWSVYMLCTLSGLGPEVPI